MKRLVVFLTALCLVFSVSAVSLTYKLISDKTASPPETVISPPDLYGTYNNNDLAIDVLVENKGGLEISIPQIKGLLDTAVQENINSELKNGMYNLISSLPLCDYTYYNVHSNFANVLSISYTASYYTEESYDSSVAVFNYDLTTGNKINFEDIFINNDYILDFVRRAFYMDLSRMGEYDSANHVFSPDENDVFKAVKAFMESENKIFAFSPAEITFYNASDYIISADLIDYADNIAIYSRFLTEESIFTGEYEGHKNIFTFANGNYEYFDHIEYGLWEDNLWVDFSTAKAYEPAVADSAFIAFKAAKYDELYLKLDEYRTLAKENPDKFYILMAKPYISQYFHSEYIDGEWEDTPSYIASVNFNSNIIEMPLEVYETTYKDKIIEGYRYKYFVMGGGLSLFTEEGDGAVLKADDYKAKTYNYKTGELLTELSDIFLEDSSYTDVITDEVKQYLYREGIYSANKYFDEIVYTLSGDGIRYSFPSLPDLEGYIHLSRFDKDSFKLLQEEQI